MALWSGLGEAATVAQLAGADLGGIISLIMQASQTARQNKRECKQLARRVVIIAQLLPHVQDPEAARPMAGLGDTLREAHELVLSCQGRSAAYHFVMARRQAARFKEMQNRIDFYLLLFPVTSHIGITRRLDGIYNLLDSIKGEPSPMPQSTQMQVSTEVAHELVAYGTQEFTLMEILAATNNFSLESVITSSSCGSGTVHRGRLRDGREVAIKRYLDTPKGLVEFNRELDILSRLRHKHIVRLFGSYVTETDEDKGLPQKKKKGRLTWWRKKEKTEEPECLIVYEYLKNKTLFHHLHPDQGSSTLSPVTVCWKMRVSALLGVSRAIEHLHCHANPPIVHRDINSRNILLDASWVPRLSHFAMSLTWDMAEEESGIETRVLGTVGYVAPEYLRTGRVKPAIDVFSLGVVMLEVLTGKKAVSPVGEESDWLLVDLALPNFKAGNIEELLDRRHVPVPTPWQLQALKHVVLTAVCCLKEAKDRPAISDIVANLDKAHELICRDEPSSVDESPPHARSVPWVAFQSEVECAEITLAENSPGGHQ